MDVEQLMSQLAVDRTIRHDDGPFHWYCDDGTVDRYLRQPQLLSTRTRPLGRSP